MPLTSKPIATVLKKIYGWFLPPICILCNHPATHEPPWPSDICQDCLNELPILPQSCPRCATPILANQAMECGICLKDPPSFDATYALYLYQLPITKLIMELKFHEKLINARILGGIMAAQIKTAWYYNKPLPDVVIPMPLHPRRLRERGFNQALEIARPIRALTHLPIDITSCLRIKSTAPQARLSGEKRGQYMKNAFLIQRDFSGLHVAVLDDVITTGQTIAEFCRALKQKGAFKIDVWCCAKTPLLKDIF
jgi:ComF family protein